MESETVPCQYCGKPCKFKGVKVHEAACEKNPKNIKPPSAPESQAPPPLVIKISDVQPYITDDVAWFLMEDGKHISLHPEHIGIVNEETCSVLVRTVYGTFLPPYLIPGFIGVLSVDTEFKEPEASPAQPEEIQPASEVVKEPVVEGIEQEKFVHSAPEPIPEKKAGLLDRFRKPKEKPATKEETMQSGGNLAKMIKDAQKAT